MLAVPSPGNYRAPYGRKRSIGGQRAIFLLTLWLAKRLHNQANLASVVAKSRCQLALLGSDDCQTLFEGCPRWLLLALRLQHLSDPPERTPERLLPAGITRVLLHKLPTNR